MRKELINMKKEQKMDFEIPAQVKFWDVDGGHYVGGIAYRDEVICGCCGGLYEISEIYEFAPEDVEPIMVYDTWVDIQAEIIGE